MDRHVAKTGDIRDFVITDESGIAKGIRRIVAVAGHEVQVVTRTAQELKERLDVIERLAGREKDTALKAFTVVLGQSDISVIKKSELRDRLGAVRKAFDRQVKEKEALANKEAVDSFHTYFKDDPEALAYIAILNISQSVVAQGKKLGKAVYVLSVDAEGGRIAHVNYVPPALKEKGLDARTWANRVTEIIGGKVSECFRESNALITGSWDRTLRFWDSRASSPQQSSHDTPERVYQIDLVNNTLVVAMASRLFNIYDIRKVDAPLRQRESSLKFMTRSLACMPDGEGYATASVEGRIAVEYFDPSPVVQEKKYAFKCHRQTINDVGHVWPVNALAFHPMYNTFASAGSDATVSIWDHKANAKDANTVDFAQREREEMRDLTKASEIISVPPPDGMEGNANHVITSMPLSTGMGIGSVPGQPQPPSVLSMQALSPPVWTPHVGQVFLGNLFLFQASSLLLERRHLLGNLLGVLPLIVGRPRGYALS
ncbi:hypothetical protein C0989_001379 [Termitomyces sp. Mn162]|nr:hypothetical protein C0989_001379 [Termitomyces sp. Mn162]